MQTNSQLDLFGGERLPPKSKRKRNGHHRLANGHSNGALNGDVSGRIESLFRATRNS